jgi:hypothetical protein
MTTNMHSLAEYLKKTEKLIVLKKKKKSSTVTEVNDNQDCDRVSCT